MLRVFFNIQKHKNKTFFHMKYAEIGHTYSHLRGFSSVVFCIHSKIVSLTTPQQDRRESGILVSPEGVSMYR